MQFSMVNSEIVPTSKAQLHLSDLALLRGFGLFDYFRVKEGVPLFLEDYLARFYRSAQRLNLEVPVSEEALKALIFGLLGANGEPDANVRLLLTGGYSEDGFTPAEPNLAALQHERKDYPSELFETGAKLITHEYVRDLPEVKSINYATAVRLIPEMKRAGAIEVLYHDDGQVAETSRANVFVVTQAGTLVTPAEGILEGITRKRILELTGEMDVEVEARAVTLDEVHAAREVFITSTTKGAMPIAEIDGEKVGGGQAGELTKRLGEAFSARVEAYIKANRATVAS